MFDIIRASVSLSAVPVVLEAIVQDSYITVTAEAFVQKLKQKYPQRASALGDHLIAAFVHDNPQYRVTYDGVKPVSVSWPRKAVSVVAKSSTVQTGSVPAPDPEFRVAAELEQRQKRNAPVSPARSGQAREPANDRKNAGTEPQLSGVNRRKQPRVPCRKTRAYVITDNVPGAVVEVVDISRGGLCFVSFDRFYPGTAVSIATHYMEGGQNIFQDGRIVRVRHKPSGMSPSEYAVEFSLG
jgi:hypothetical protein